MASKTASKLGPNLQELQDLINEHKATTDKNGKAFAKGKHRYDYDELRKPVPDIVRKIIKAAEATSESDIANKLGIPIQTFQKMYERREVKGKKVEVDPDVRAVKLSKASKLDSLEKAKALLASTEFSLLDGLLKEGYSAKAVADILDTAIKFSNLK